MKRVISVILTIIMIFTFASCGELTASSQSVVAQIKGNGKKTIKLTLKGALEGCEKEVVIPNVIETEEDVSVTYFEVTKQKDNGKTFVCQFRGVMSGIEDFNVRITKDEKLLANVKCTVVVDDNLKLTYDNLTVSADEYVEIGQGDEDGVVRIPYVEDGNATIEIKELDGPWLADSYDQTIVSVKDYGKVDDEYVQFVFNPVSEGDYTVQFLNLDSMKQVVVSAYNEKISFGDGVEGYISYIKDYVYADYTMEEYIARRGQGETILQIRRFDPDFMIPTEFVIQGYSIFNSKKDVEFEFDDNLAIVDTVIPDEYNQLDVDILSDEKIMSMTVYSDYTVEKAYKEVEDLGKPEKVEDLTLNGIDVRLYQTSYGFGYAVWEENDMVHAMTFMYEGSSFDSDKELLTKYFESRVL